MVDKMAVYSFYKYELSQINELEAMMLCDESHETPLSLAQETFNGLFHGVRPLNITKEDKDKNVIPLNNEVTFKRDRVTILLVCNEKKLKYTEKKDERELTSHPGCYVIIDNREGIAQMAIERSSSFQSDPDKVCLLLQQALNDKLAAYRLKIDIRGKVREAPFWEVIRQQTVEHKDRIKWIKFNFGVPEESAGIDATERMKAMISGLNQLGRAMGAEKGQYMYNASETGTLHLDQTQEDMAQVIHYCSTNAYDISVGFRYYGVYRYGREERAYAQLDDTVLDDFMHDRPTTDSEGNPAWGLHLWLDNMRRMYEKYRDVTPTKKKRKRKSKKQAA